MAKGVARIPARVPLGAGLRPTTLVVILAVILVPLLVGTWLLAAPPAAQASVILPMTLEELTTASERVVYARTVSVETRLAPDSPATAGGTAAATRSRMIETVARLEVIDTAKGRAANELIVVVPGGTIGDLTLRVDGVPSFVPGETSLVFVDERGRVVGGPQGKMAVVGGRVSGPDRPLGEVMQRVGGVDDSAAVSRSIAVPAPAGLRGAGQKAGSLAASAAAASLEVAATENAFADGFETGMGAWSLYGSPSWGATVYRAAAGTRSAYCVGSSISAPGPYPNNTAAWMIAGPFDLSGVTAATLEYDQYLSTQNGNDYCLALASTDGSLFYGSGWSGSTGGQWAAESLNLAAVPGGSGYIDMTGSSSLWLAFYFESDASTTGEGAYIDNVALVTGSEPPPSGTPAIASISPSSASAGTNTPVTITGTGFGATQGSGRVEFYYRDSTRMSAPVISWSDTSIVCIVPTAEMSGYPGSAGSGPVTVVNSSGVTSSGYDFSVTFGYGGIKWATPACNFRVNPNTPDTASELSLFDAGAGAWNGVSSFRFADVGACAATTWSGNDVNEVFWTGDELSSGILAQAWTWYIGSTIVETDIGFNDTYLWGSGSGGSYDIQSIASHELGHWLNLRDLYGPGDSGKVMYGFGSAGVQKRTLHAGDLAGIQWIYGGGQSISSVAPAAGPVAGGNAVVITGASFTGVTAVKFGTTNAQSFVVDSATRITAVAPAHGAGAADVSVITGSGVTPNTAADNYTYVAAPVVAGISPVSGPEDGGTAVAIAGAGFAGATSVTFGGVPATSFAVQSDALVTATAPAGSGTVAVRVSTVGGTSLDTAADDFTYVPRPAVTRLYPACGPVAGGNRVVIEGAGFAGVTDVRFGGQALDPASYVVESSTRITVAGAPAQPAGGVQVQVVAGGAGSLDTLADDYLYSATPPEVTLTIQPSTGGSVGKSPDKTAYYLGELVSLVTTADPGWGFVGWSGDIEGQDDPLELIMDDDLSIAATFVENPLWLAAGWNLVAAAPGTDFGTTLFSWNGSGYLSVTDPASWEGYWIRSSAARAVSLVTTSGPWTVALRDGWNLIGNPMDGRASLVLPMGRAAFAYDAAAGGYLSTSIVEPGQGVWVRGAQGEVVSFTPQP